MDVNTKRAFHSVINEWRLGEKKYGLESRALSDEKELPNGELKFSFKTQITPCDEGSIAIEEGSFTTNTLPPFGNVRANLEKLKLFLDSLSDEAYEKMEEQNN